jgi:hypothetical protein
VIRRNETSHVATAVCQLPEHSYRFTRLLFPFVSRMSALKRFDIGRSVSLSSPGDALSELELRNEIRVLLKTRMIDGQYGVEDGQ